MLQAILITECDRIFSQPNDYEGRSPICASQMRQNDHFLPILPWCQNRIVFLTPHRHQTHIRQGITYKSDRHGDDHFFSPLSDHFSDLEEVF